MFSHEIKMIAESYYTHARMMISEGNTDAAIKALKSAIAEDYHFDKAYGYLAEIYQNQGTAYKWVEFFLEMLKKDSKIKLNDSTFDAIFVDINFIENISQEARETLGQYLNERGNDYYLMDKLKEAESCFTRVTIVNPLNPLGYNNRGNVYFVQKKYDKAIAFFTYAIELNPKAIYYKNRAISYEKQGKILEAIADCRSALEKYPNYNEVEEKLNSLLQQNDKEKLFTLIQSAPDDKKLAMLLYATAPSTPPHHFYKVMSQKRGTLEPSHERGTLKKLLHELNITLIKQSMGDAATPEVIQQFEKESEYNLAGGYLLERHKDKSNVISKYFSLLSNLVEQDKNIHQQIAWLLKLQNRNGSSLGHVIAFNYNNGLMYLMMLAKMLEQGLPPAEVLAMLSAKNIARNTVQHMIFRYQDMKAILLNIDILTILNQTESLREIIQILITDMSSDIFELATYNRPSNDMAVIIEKMLSAKLLPLSMAANVFKHILHLPEETKYGIFTRAITEGNEWNSYFKNQPDILKKIDELLLAAQLSILAETELEEAAAAAPVPAVIPAAFVPPAPSAPVWEEDHPAPRLYPDLASAAASVVAAPVPASAPLTEVNISPVIERSVVIKMNLFDDLLKEDNGAAPVVEFTNYPYIEMSSEKKVVPQVAAAAQSDLISFPDEEPIEQQRQREKIQQVLAVMKASPPVVEAAEVSVPDATVFKPLALSVEDLLASAPDAPTGLLNSSGFFSSKPVPKVEAVEPQAKSKQKLTG